MLIYEVVKRKKKVRQWLSSNDLEINTEESSFYKGVMFNDMGDMKIFEEHTELHRKRQKYDALMNQFIRRKKDAGEKEPNQEEGVIDLCPLSLMQS